MARGGAHVGAEEMRKKEQQKETSVHQPQAPAPALSHPRDRVEPVGTTRGGETKKAGEGTCLE